ncbi:octaprenyl-diphosphate synthase [bacterium BMS3Bbin11]|nr:octaprenyl-diphosphate synthase [bacterium BMS3Bbin11]GMT40463.1 MAG: octaprenyl diphosphate synthase [bacterium]HDH08664.1 octaprenyl diphosphate synthase [Gammaproteobacteria bacterium]
MVAIANKKPGTPQDSASVNDFKAVQSLLKSESTAVDQLILHRLSSDVVLINQLGTYIINSGGKRLRPMIVLLSALASGYQEDKHILLAAVIEFIHTATLLHDDVVDSSDMRRGKATANDIWGNDASVLVGDFLYSRAFEMMVEVGNMHIMDILSHTTNNIAEGEVMQLLNINDPDISEQRYDAVIRAKTAILFEAAARVGSVIANQNDEVEQALANYGQHLGVAFQLVDDLLDYSSSSEALGKNVGDDLAEGKPTLPLIHAMQYAASSDRDLLSAAIRSGGLEKIDEVIAIIESTGSLAYTSQRASAEAEKAKQALSPLPQSAYKDAMMILADFSVQRVY